MNDYSKIKQVYKTADTGAANRYLASGWQLINVLQFAYPEDGGHASPQYILGWPSESKPIHPEDPSLRRL